METIFDLIREQLQESKGIARILSKLKSKGPAAKAREVRRVATQKKLEMKRLKSKQEVRKEVSKKMKSNKLKRKLRRGEPINVTPVRKRIAGAQKQIEYKPGR